MSCLYLQLMVHCIRQQLGIKCMGRWVVTAEDAEGGEAKEL